MPRLVERDALAEPLRRDPLAAGAHGAARVLGEARVGRAVELGTITDLENSLGNSLILIRLKCLQILLFRQ